MEQIRSLVRCNGSDTETQSRIVLEITAVPISEQCLFTHALQDYWISKGVAHNYCASRFKTALSHR